MPETPAGTGFPYDRKMIYTQIIDCEFSVCASLIKMIILIGIKNEKNIIIFGSFC